MHKIIKGAGLAFGTLALTGTAAAQPAQGGWVNDRAVVAASLDIGNSGNFTGVIDPQTNRMCYILNAGAVEQPTGAVIRTGEPGANGAPVVELENPADGASGGCVDLRPELVESIVHGPVRYHLAITTAAFPQGYVNAPLTVQRPTAPS